MLGCTDETQQVETEKAIMTVEKLHPDEVTRREYRKTLLPEDCPKKDCRNRDGTRGKLWQYNQSLRCNNPRCGLVINDNVKVPAEARMIGRFLPSGVEDEENE